MKRIVLATASILALTLGGAVAMAQPSSNAGPGTRATESPGNTATDQTNMGTSTGTSRPGHSTDCGPGSRASNDANSTTGSHAAAGSSMANDCGSAGSSTSGSSSEKR